MKSNYNKFPSTKIKGHEHAAVVGYNNILDTLKKEIPSGKYILTCDCLLYTSLNRAGLSI